MVGMAGSVPAAGDAAAPRQRRIQDHVERRMSHNDARACVFKEGRGNLAVHASLSEFHISI